MLQKQKLTFSIVYERNFSNICRYHTSLGVSQSMRACRALSGHKSHTGQIPSVLTPLVLRKSIVGRAFMQARQAKILIFAGMLRCHILFQRGERGSSLELSPSLNG